MRQIGTMLLVLALLCPALADASSREYDPQKAGHPIRVAAYVLHPVGVILDRVLFRPAWTVGQREPFRTLFGVERPEWELEETSAATTAD